MKVTFGIDDAQFHFLVKLKAISFYLITEFGGFPYICMVQIQKKSLSFECFLQKLKINMSNNVNNVHEVFVYSVLLISRICWCTIICTAVYSMFTT